MSKLTRRTMLISGSTALLLPILEANAIGKLATTAAAPPKRLVFLPMGYGVHEDWFPSTSQVGTDYKIPSTLAAFKDLKPDFSVIQNLSHSRKAGPHGGSINWLTSAGKKDKKTVSCDQVAAQIIGRDTRHSSLALAGGPARVDGHDGYVSWGQDGKPVGLYRKLEDVYVDIFGSKGNAADIKAKLAREKSGLDAIMGNAKRLEGHISASDRHRVDEYFTSVRNIEKRIAKSEAWLGRPRPKAPYPTPQNLRGKEEIEIMLDLMRIAMQSDTTRVMTYMLPTQNILKELDSKLNPHRMSHKASEDIHKQRDLLLSELVADFVRKLKETKEADGSSVLDNSLVVFGSALRAGHNQSNGPTLLAGHGGGGLKQGQNLVYEKNTPLSNLWLSLLRHVGYQNDQFAESKGIMTEMGFK